jgi:hypothetical protein
VGSELYGFCFNSCQQDGRRRVHEGVIWEAGILHRKSAKVSQLTVT